MQPRYELTSNYVALLDQIRYLLSRENLCNNTYLFKQMKPNLTVPLYILAEERKIAAISSNEQELINALKESGFAIVQNNREVVIIDYPTIKICVRNQQIYHEIDRALKEKDIKYSFSERNDQNFINFTIYSETQEFLENFVASLSKEIEFERVSLYEDIRAGTLRIKKLKQENKNNSYAGKAKYSSDKPPQIFIRRAVESSDEEENEERHKGKYSNDRKKKYKEVVREPTNKPKFNNDDFPSLS